MRRAAAGVSAGGGSFDPTVISWHSMFWTEGDDFIAEGYSDTDAVGTWPNETGESDATEATNRPTFDAVNAAYNDAPTVHFSASNSKLQTGTFSTSPTTASSIVVVGNYGVVSGYRCLFDSVSGTRRQAFWVSADGTQWTIFARSAEVSGGAADTNPHLFVCYFDGSSGNDTITVDGTEVASGNAGSSTPTGLTLGNLTNGTGSFQGDLAFVGKYQGDVTAHESWGAVEAGIASHYGITVA